MFWQIEAICCLLFGNVYCKKYDADIQINGKKEKISVYHAPGKKFLLVGPHKFEKDYFDFFFINKNQVLRSGIDKGGDAWLRIGQYLFILDDLSSGERLRSPIWDDLQCDKESSIVHDNNKFIFCFKLSDTGENIKISIDDKLLK